MPSSAQELLLGNAPWSDACESFSAQVRRDLQAMALPLLDAAEATNRYPKALLTEFAKAGHFRRRWAASGVAPGIGDVGIGLCTYYEAGRLLLGGLGIGLALQMESLLSCLAMAQPKLGTTDIFEEAVSGALIGCLAITDPATGSDLAGLRLTAKRAGSGYLLNGKKKYISLSSTADMALTLARTGEGEADLSMFLVPQGPEGYRVERTLKKMGTLSIETNVLDFDDVQVGADNLVGQEGQGLYFANHALTLERLAGCALLLGAYETSIEIARAYVRHRTTRTGTIWDHQAIRHRFADLFADHQTLLHSLRYTAWEVQHKKGKERQVCGLKLTVASRVERGISEALQLLGGAGYVDDWPLERALRDCRLARIVVGSDEVMREFIANEPMSEAAYEAWLDHRQVA